MSKLNNANVTKVGSPLAQGGRAQIEDIPAVGEELSEEHLRFVSGGEPICTCSGNGTCRFTYTESRNACFAISD
jgi:hypothetical protein